MCGRWFLNELTTVQRVERLPWAGRVPLRAFYAPNAPPSWNFPKNNKQMVILTANKFLIILYGNMKLETFINVVWSPSKEKNTGRRGKIPMISFPGQDIRRESSLL